MSHIHVSPDRLLMYGDLAPWFHLLTAPADYAEEAAFISGQFDDACEPGPQTVLELGSGGGNNASHLKRRFELTLVDLSEGMLELSRGLNPECRHILGDMRQIRIDGWFDGVLVHDAIMYMTTRHDLELAAQTAFVHCRPGGVALFLPDCVAESFRPETRHGGHDSPEGHGMRYLEWTFDPDPEDTHFDSAFVYMLRDAPGKVRVFSEHHRMGLFSRAVWHTVLEGVGFEVESVVDRWDREVFIALRPEG